MSAACRYPRSPGSYPRRSDANKIDGVSPSHGWPDIGLLVYINVFRAGVSLYL